MVHFTIAKKVRYLIFYISLNISMSIKMSLGDKLKIVDGHMFDKPFLFIASIRAFHANEFLMAKKLTVDTDGCRSIHRYCEWMTNNACNFLILHCLRWISDRQHTCKSYYW